MILVLYMFLGLHIEQLELINYHLTMANLSLDDQRPIGPEKITCFLLNYPAYAAALEVLTELTSLFCTSVKDSLWATEF